VFFIEACKALQGDYPLLQEYPQSIRKRVLMSFGNNPVPALFLNIDSIRRIKKLPQINEG